MNEELAALIAERGTARTAFVETRFHRDTAARHYDSVVREHHTVTQPAWDAFTARQQAMDMAGDRLILASGAVTDHVLLDI
jgi:hypothetical protein